MSERSNSVPMLIRAQFETRSLDILMQQSNAGYHACWSQTQCATQQAGVVHPLLQPSRKYPITRAVDPTTITLCQNLRAPPRHHRQKSSIGSSSSEVAVYSGSRWQPNKPRPPQFLRGVSCICTVSAEPPELLSRRAFTVIGIWSLLVCVHKVVNSTPCR